MNRHLPTPNAQVARMNCWAACLAWWLRYMNYNGLGGHKIHTQDDITREFKRYGGLSEESIVGVLGHEWFGLDTQFEPNLNPSNLCFGLSKSPVLVFFKYPTGGLHVNVVYDFNSTTHKVDAMEPYKGKFLVRSLDFFQPTISVKEDMGENNLGIYIASAK